MMAACKSHNVKLSLGFMMRFHPHHVRAKELVDSGAMGDLVCASVQWNFAYPPKSGLWRQDPSVSGGGCLMDVGIHCVDLLRFFMGEVEEVVAMTGNVVFQYPVEDISTLILRFKGGAQAVVENSFAVDAKHSRNGLELLGTKGRIMTRKSISCFIGGEMTTEIAGTTTDYPPSEVDSYQKEIEAFGVQVSDNPDNAHVDDGGLQALKVVLAAYESAASGRRIRLG